MAAKRSDVPRVLIDNCVTSRDTSDPARWKDVEDTGCGIRLGNKLRVYEIEPLDTTQREKMALILAIGRAASQGQFSACICKELFWESLLSYHSWKAALSPLAAFNMVEFEEIPSPIERSKLFQSSDWVMKHRVEQFMDFLLDVNPSQLYQVMCGMNKFSKFELENARNIQKFKALCDEKVLKRKPARDAFHLWAAECSNVDYFLTIDMKFLRPYRQAIRSKKINFKCKAVSPEELIECLGISTEDIFIPETGKRYTMFGMEC